MLLLLYDTSLIVIRHRWVRLCTQHIVLSFGMQTPWSLHLQGRSHDPVLAKETPDFSFTQSSLPLKFDQKQLQAVVHHLRFLTLDPLMTGAGMLKCVS